MAAVVQQPINAEGTSTFARRGVIPVKFTLASNGAPTCTLPSATIRLTRMSGAQPSAVDESIYSNPADTGSVFRISNCQYVYNLAAKGLTPGRYLVELLIDSTVTRSVSFEIA